MEPLKIVRYTDTAGQPGEAVVDTLLVATGRVPNVEGLGLEEVGVTYDRRLGVQVDARLRTTNPRIFAAGDVCSRYQFTHAADALARLVLANAVHGPPESVSLDHPLVHVYGFPRSPTSASPPLRPRPLGSLLPLSCNRSRTWTAPSWTAKRKALPRST